MVDTINIRKNSLFEAPSIVYKNNQYIIIIALISFVIFLTVPLYGFQREYHFYLFLIFVIILGIVSIRLLFILFILLLPVPFCATIGSYNINLMDVICGVFLCYLVFSKNSVDTRKIKFYNILILYYLFYFIYFFNGPFLLSRLVADIVRFAIEPIVIFLTAIKLIRDKKDIKIITVLLLFSTSLASIVALYQFSFIFNIPQWEQNYTNMINLGFYPKYDFRFFQFSSIDYRRPGGFFQYGSELSTFIPVSIYLSIHYLNSFKLKRYHRIITILIIILLVLGLIASSGRGMVIAFGISFLVYFLLLKRSKFKVLVISGTLLFILINYFVPEYLMRVYLLKDRVESMYSRAELSKEAINESMRLPTIITGTTDPQRPQSHNKFIEELHTKGILGLIIYMILQLKLLKHAFDKKRKSLLIPLLVFWFITSLTTASPYGTIHTHFLFPIVLVMSTRL